MKNLHFFEIGFTIETPHNSITKTMTLDQFTTMRGYQLAASEGSSKIIDHMLQGDQGDAIREGLKLKRIQFDTSPLLWEKLEGICATLDCSKREFLEMAISEAVHRADLSFQKAFQEAAGVDLAEAFPAGK